VSTQESFALAFQHHQAGRLEEAEQLYRQVLAAEPDHADAMHLLGVIADTCGRGAEAVELIAGAIRLQPTVPTYYSNLGEAYRQLGRADDAIAHYRRAIELKPDYAIAHFNLANTLAGVGRKNEAIVAFRAAVRAAPGFADAHYNFGNLLRDCGRFSEALDQYQAAVQARPHFADALNNLGSALADLRGDTEGALTALRAALALQPDFANAHLNLGNVLRARGRMAEAISEYQAALGLTPKSLDARSNLGVALLEQGRPQAALEVVREMLAIAPKHPEALLTLGNCFVALQRFDEAVAAYRAAVEQNPRFVEARYNIGLALKAQGRFAEAAEALRAAVETDGHDPAARLNYAFALLLTGELRQGWPFYEARFDTGKMAPQRRHQNLPLWFGRSTADCTVLIYSEQGLGDGLQFVRYAPLIAAQGARVVVECPATLVELFRTIDGIEVVPDGEPLPPCDFQVPMLSLPLAFGTELRTIPAGPAYLRPDPERRAAWRARLGAPGSRLRVGLAWAGSATHIRDRERSMRLEQLAAFFSVPNVDWFSLQIGPAAAQIAKLPLADHTRELRNMGDTAALVAELDLVIAVDTSVVHLAGALGRPVWTMLPFSPDWRWLLERDDSPWYPTMRLFRQRTAGDWSSVVHEVRRQLEVLAKAKYDDRPGV
jgi:tetratricopeptide (TPR) repeat protein